MPLDPQAKAVLDQLTAPGVPPMHTLPPAVARANFEAAPRAPGPSVAQVEDRRIPGGAGGVPVRIYTPTGQEPFPLLLWFHGGGWVLGSVNTHDATCRRLAGQAGCCVVSVDYRLAPEAKFPAAVEDCYTATLWAAKNAALLHADPRKIAVGGESAGGNLAASVALLARDQGGPSLVQQVLVYPVIQRNFGTPSYRDNGQGYWLTRETMEWFWGLYLRDEADATDPRAAPILARSLAGLPPALVITAEFDPLRDEGEAYARRLADAGVPTARTRYTGMIHGFFGRPTEIDKAKEAVAQVASALKAAFAR